MNETAAGAHHSCSEEMGIEAWENNGGFVLYIIVAGYVFYFMEVICDEYFVPALTLLCRTLKLSDNVAGATFMAAGASSPELFVALCGVLSHSPVGTGTVVGSELFNMLVIVGFSALCSSTPMKLDWRVLLRELFFYGLSLVLLIYVLNDHAVHLVDAILLVCAYAVYVFVCAFYSRWVNCCCPTNRGTSSDQGNYDAPEVSVWEPTIETGHVVRAGSFSSAINEAEAEQRHEHAHFGNPMIIDDTSFNEPYVPPEADADMAPSTRRPERRTSTLRNEYFPSPYTAMMTMLSARHDNIMNMNEEEAPIGRKRTRGNGGGYRLNSMPMNEGLLGDQDQIDSAADLRKAAMEGYMFKQSTFYTRLRATGKMWQLRYFWLEGCEGSEATFKTSTANDSKNALCYCRNPANPDEGKSTISLKKVTEVNTHGDLHFGLKLVDRTINFRAKDIEDRNKWIAAITVELDRIYKFGAPSVSEQDENIEKENHSLIKYPRRAKLLKRIIWIACCPLYFLFHLTIPDVRKGGFWQRLYPLTLFSVITWLAALSFSMVTATDRLGCILGIPSDVMGLTVGSIGTSLPNLFASILVAKQGLANMAVSNAFGSNVFNIFIALGLPWLIQTAIVAPGQAYPVASTSINSTILILAGFLMVFILILIVVKATIGKKVGSILLVLYVVFLTYMILSCVGVLPAIPST